MQDNHSVNRLVCHQSTSCPAVNEIKVSVSLTADLLQLSYSIDAEMTKLRIPPQRPAARTDNLWLHNCFEVFIRDGLNPEYLEFNFSPSGEWAAYRFLDYRQGGFSINLISPPEVRISQGLGRLELEAVVPLHDMRIRNECLQLGLAVVVESCDGGLSYWALTHPSEKPDFHHPDSFALSLAMDGMPKN